MMTRKFSRLWLLVLVVLPVTLFVASCGKPADATKIRVGFLPYSSSLSFFVAKEKGLLSKSGLKIETVKCASANEAIDALRAGHLDFVMGVGLTTFFAVEGASAGSFKCFQPCLEDASHDVSYLLVPKDSAITDVRQLKGKRLGTYSGTSQVLVLKLLVQKLGFDPVDVTIGDVAANLQVDAIKAGQFDAFLTIEPYARKAMILHGARPLIENPRVKYILDPFPAGANAVRTKFMEQYAELTRKLIAALDEAIQMINVDPAVAKAVLPQCDETVSAEIASKTGLYRWWKTSETDLLPIQTYADLLYAGKALKNPVKVVDMFLRQ